jgi:hypothetical protein
MRRSRLDTLVYTLAVLLAAAPLPALAIELPPPISPTGVLTTINVGPVRQLEPRVSGNLAAYTAYLESDPYNPRQIRYFDFSTNTDAAIPPLDAEAQVYAPDVSGTRIAYTWLTPSTQESRIVVFDTSGQSSFVIPGTQRRFSAIGGDTVAFEEYASPDIYHAEIVVYDLATDTTTPLTSDGVDGLVNAAPRVSPDGNVVVWQKCKLGFMGSLFDCDIYQAVRTSGEWVTTQLTGPEGGEEFNPDTNGSVVVYTVSRDGETDIAYRPVGGGAETQITLPDPQDYPSIAGRFIVFRWQFSQPNQEAPFVYDTATNTLYQIAQLPGVAEPGDITVLPDGRVRVVYMALGNDWDVHGFTFQPIAVPTTFTLSLSEIQLRAAGAPDKVQVQGTFQLAGASDGIDPAAQPVSLRLSTPAGEFYPALASGLMPISGFDVTPTGWAISATEKRRTGIQSFVIDRTPTGFSFSLVDTGTALPALDYTAVSVELVIGNDAGSASASLRQWPASSGNWQLR